MSTADPASMEARAAEFRDAYARVKAEISKVIVGHDDIIHGVLTCLFVGGHALLEGVPGLGKTLLIRTLADSLSLDFNRIQFTPDLMPADIIGTNIVMETPEGKRSFVFQRGPIFSQIVLADEINRATPKTQSALLEAMAERQVTVDGVTYHLPPPFMVIATQNPIEHEGTYPLPESQLDRFLMRVSVGYPGRDAEVSILDTHGGDDALARLGPVLTAGQIAGLVSAVRSVHVATALRSYLVELAEATRRHSAVAVGMSPRATLALQRVARARAATQGRSYVVPDDVKVLAESVLSHRLILSPEAQLQGMTAADVVSDILRNVPIPAAPRPA